MTVFLWGPSEALIVPAPTPAFLMNNDDSGRCQMFQVGVPELDIINSLKTFADKNKVFIDCGAHMGVYSILLADGFKRVFAFEAQRRTYLQLCGNIFLNEKQNITPYALGIAEATDSRTLYVVSEDGGGSTFYPPDVPVLQTETVEIKALDELDIPKENIGLIKLDVEGYELNIIKGALHTLKQSNYPPIAFESNSGRENYKTRRSLFKELQNLNYEIKQFPNFDNMFLALQVN